MTNAKTDKYQTMKHFHLWGGVVPIASVMGTEQAPSADTFFLVKMRGVQGLTSSEATSTEV